MRKLAIGLATLVALGAATYVGSYFLTVNSEGFQFVSSEIRRLKSVEKVVGHVSSVRLPFVGLAEQKFAGEQSTVTLDILIIGTAANATALAKATGQGGKWKMTELYLDGNLVSLETK